MAIHRFDNLGGQDYVDNQNTPGKYHDGGGLYLIVKPSGAKSWVLRYRRKQPGKASYGEMGLGSTQDYTLDESRERARVSRQQADRGDDPKQKRNDDVAQKQRDQAKRVTMAEACADYIKSLRKKEQNESGSKRNRAQAESVVRRYILPAIGDWRMDTIEPNDAAKIIEPIAEATPGMAVAVEAHGRTIFKRGQRKGWYPENKLNPFSRKGAVGLIWEDIEVKPPKHHLGLPAMDIPAFIQRLRTPSGGGTGILIAEAAEMVGIDRSEVLRAIYRGELRAHRPDNKGFNMPWFIWPNDLFKWRPQKGDLPERWPISVASRCLQYTIFTVGRPEQVRFMRWEDYDPTGARIYEVTDGRVEAAGHFWIVPYQRHKIGRKTRQPLIVPLSSAAVQIIKQQERFQSSDAGFRSDFVFAHGRALTWKGERNGRSLTEAAVQGVFDQAIVRGGLTVYGFRASFCTWAYEQMKYYPDAIEMTMGHARRILMNSLGRPSRDKTRESYDFAQLIPARRQLLEDWGNHCTSPAPVPSQVIVSPETLAERRRLKNA
jgi:integrase